jgi:hypothetical protein
VSFARGLGIVELIIGYKRRQSVRGVSGSMQLIAGRTGQEYNQRKARHGAESWLSQTKLHHGGTEYAEFG